MECTVKNTVKDYGILKRPRTISRYKLLIFNNIRINSDMIKQGNGALSGTRTHATGFGDLYSIQLSYERLFWIAHIITKKTVR